MRHIWLARLRFAYTLSSKEQRRPNNRLLYFINEKERMSRTGISCQGNRRISWHRTVMNTRGVWHLCLHKAGQTGRAHKGKMKVLKTRVIRPLPTNHRAHKNTWRRSLENDLKATVLKYAILQQDEGKDSNKMSDKQLKRKTNSSF